MIDTGDGAWVLVPMAVYTASGHGRAHGSLPCLLSGAREPIRADSSSRRPPPTIDSRFRPYTEDG
jgi:hypothetical protein